MSRKMFVCLIVLSISSLSWAVGQIDIGAVGSVNGIAGGWGPGSTGSTSWGTHTSNQNAWGGWVNQNSQMGVGQTATSSGFGAGNAIQVGGAAGGQGQIVTGTGAAMGQIGAAGSGQASNHVGPGTTTTAQAAGIRQNQSNPWGNQTMTSGTGQTSNITGNGATFGGAVAGGLQLQWMP